MDSNSNRKNQRKNRENRWQIELKSETLTLTLEVKGRGTYLVCASLPPPVRGMRLRPTRRTSRYTEAAGLPLRDARVARAGLESLAPSTAGSTAARSPSGERARRRAGRGGAALPAPPGHHGQWPSPPFRGERRRGGRE